MENLWIWLIPIGGLVVIGFVVYWRQPYNCAAKQGNLMRKRVPPNLQCLLKLQKKRWARKRPFPPRNHPQFPITPKAHPGAYWSSMIWPFGPTPIRHFSSLFNCEVRHASRLTAAVQELARWKPQLIILDLHMPRDPWQPVPALQGKYAPDKKHSLFVSR